MSLFSTQFLPAKPKTVSEDALRGTYEIEGLYPGYGHTLGNSLRRIILSSMPGTAITSVKIDGIDHEFSTLPGVKEDVIMILLALKKVCFVFSGEEPQTAKLKIKGVKTVTAGDIEVGGQVSVFNPELPIATLTDKNALLNIEMTVEKGLGYVSREILRQGRSEVGTIFLDAVFTPIRRASYEVENMRVGDRTDYNRLRLNIETDGTITPRETFTRALEIMIAQLQALLGLQDEIREKEVVELAEQEKSAPAGEEKEIAPDVLKTRMEELSLSGRIAKALSSAGIRTVGGLTRKTEEDLLAIAGLGEKGLVKIKKALGELGVTLK
jgi:DNA-directed RNA polymerase subunit alpha